ncbi:MAG: acyl-CoA dehydrogenase [Planctomycetes bacterium]|nr:acyl-CoA dehydrogenase [Planctomycetota bacterium]
MTLTLIIAALVGGCLLFRGHAWLSLVSTPAVVIAGWTATQGDFAAPQMVSTCVLVLVGLITSVPSLRRWILTGPAMTLVAPLLPRMSQTERVALEAGSVWWDGELFSGNPDWAKLAAFEIQPLSPEEESFLEQEVETLCHMTDSSQVDDLGDLPPETWAYLKANGFMGLIIPKKYGGLGFSARAISEIITRCSSHNVTLAITVMLPASLGPAELLLHYGTQEQKEHWLPRLARGDEIPAFALTEPLAGSDAASLTSRGVICHEEWKGKRALGVRLTWNKRYITLAPVATLLGIAFQLEDPDGLIGDEVQRGITLALVPTDLPGVEIGDRHDPLGVKFINGPTTGEEVFVPLSMIIGEAEQVGNGWRMLMDCLSAGRSISLPGLATGATQTTLRTVTSYGLLREQFGMPIVRFEGVEERVSKLAGHAWWMDAARQLTAGAVASGEKPAVLSAIMKAYTTEYMRTTVNQGMDVLAGAAICRGPRNVLAGYYQSIPIGITVEGANILTRTMIIFGQGALRCHPYAFDEVDAVEKNDAALFDRAFSGHVGHVVSTGFRAALLGWSAGLLASNSLPGRTGRATRQATRLSAAFALVSEAAMITLGANLKRKERVTARLADALAHLYFASAAIHRDATRGQRSEEAPFFEWAMRTHLGAVEDAILGVLENLDSRWLARSLRLLMFPLGRQTSPPSDALEQQLALLAISDESVRNDLTHSVHLPKPERGGLGALEQGREVVLKVRPLRKRLNTAVHSGELPKGSEAQVTEAALEKGLITQEEAQLIEEARLLQEDLIQVDTFGPEAYRARCGS